MPLVLPMFVGIGIDPYLQFAVNILLSNRWIGKLDPSAEWNRFNAEIIVRSFEIWRNDPHSGHR
jgi:hypothetical protein